MAGSKIRQGGKGWVQSTIYGSKVHLQRLWRQLGDVSKMNHRGNEKFKFLFKPVKKASTEKRYLTNGLKN